MKRGLASPPVHSALPMTRRDRLQLSSVDQVKSLKRRAGPAVCSLCRRAASNSGEIAVVRRAFLARPNRKSTPFLSHHPINSSRANPESARSRMRTRGQRVRMRAAMRATSSTAPALASMFEGRNLAAKRCRPQKTVAVAVVVTVEEAALLVAVQRVVGGIEVEDDLPRRAGMGVEKQIDQQGFDRLRVVPDLVIGRRPRLAQLEPVKRRFAGHRRTVLAP